MMGAVKKISKPGDLVLDALPRTHYTANKYRFWTGIDGLWDGKRMVVAWKGRLQGL